MDLRPVSSDDLGACTEVYYAAEDELYGRSNQPPLPRNPQSLERLFGHILATDPELCWLAHDGPRIEGFALAVRRDNLYFLSFLFIRPERQRKGLGRRLLERCLPGEGRRATCVEAIQPVSTALYAVYGIAPRVPIYTLTGKPAMELPRLPAGAQVALQPISEPDADIDALDGGILGITRPQDHRAWLGWGRRAFVLHDRRTGAARAYGYVHESGRVGPVVARTEGLLLPLLGELLTRVTPAEGWQILVPGPAKETLVALLRAGMRLEGPPALFCASESGIDHSRYLPSTYALP